VSSSSVQHLKIMIGSSKGKKKPKTLINHNAIRFKMNVEEALQNS
jgi:hypothetical protein